ncbi:hypothetical protein [uncultured Cyclobacterium sp.]|uniref:hypothetical protein n=1 Tax=uncultured Cyclobacterium sp. TaxID=453820 RepID=UPI0030EB2384|tara:strand:- start:15712 stop:16251 length:540 start_codon:yes stop_codon:yes gene_type:complete
MNENFHISEIISDGFKTIENSGKRFLVLILTPIIIGITISIYKDIEVNKDYINIIISSLSIFTGFFFTLIVYVADKAANKKNEYRDKKNEEDIRFINTYLDFIEKLISQISYSIILSVIIICISLVSQLELPCLIDGKYCHHFDLLITSIVISLIFHFLIYLLLIISNMYALFLEEIKR